MRFGLVTPPCEPRYQNWGAPSLGRMAYSSDEGIVVNAYRCSDGGPGVGGVILVLGLRVAPVQGYEGG